MMIIIVWELRVIVHEECLQSALTSRSVLQCWHTCHCQPGGAHELHFVLLQYHLHHVMEVAEIPGTLEVCSGVECIGEH